MKYFYALNLLLKILSYLKKKRIIQLYLMIVLLIISSLMEVFSIGMIIPFIAVLLEPSKLITMYEFLNISNLLENIEIEKQRFLLTSLFIITFTFSIFFRILNNYVFQRISRAIATDLNLQVFKNFLEQDYSLSIKENSSLRISLMTEKMQNVVGVIYNFLTFCSSLFILIVIGIFCLVISPKLSSITFVVLIIIYLIMSKFLNKILIGLSKTIMLKMSSKLKIIQESFGGLRQIILDKTQNVYFAIFEIDEHNLRVSEAKNNFYIALPRFLVELVALIVLSIYAYYLTSNKLIESFELITFLGFIGFASSRLLPITSTMYHSLTSFLGNIYIVNELLNYLKASPQNQVQNPVGEKKIEFNNIIKFENVGFRYNDSSNFELKNINFEIKKGEKIGIIGETGYGKSTIIDLLIGLLKPIKGEILIDNTILGAKTAKNWQGKISHVPQDIFLMDRSIAENIAFSIGKKNIDYEILKKSIEAAELKETIKTLKDKENTLIGERGIYLSGGQKQRVGLARAFYHHKKLLILDEATSSLDVETEEKIINNINKNYKDLTIIQISHRIQTLKFTDKILKFEKNNFVNIINYKDIK